MQNYKKELDDTKAVENRGQYNFMKSLNEASKKDNLSLQNELKQLQKSIENYKEENAKLQKELDDTKAMKDREQYDFMKSLNEASKKDNLSLQNELKQLQKSIANYKEETAKLQKELDDTKAKTTRDQYDFVKSLQEKEKDAEIAIKIRNR